MTPEETAAAQGLAGLRGDEDPPDAENTPGAGTTSPAHPSSGERNTQSEENPLPSLTPTLIESLQKLGEEQAEDEDVLTDMKIQGKTRPNSYKVFREHAVLQDELFVVVAMMNSQFVQPLHSFIKFASSGRQSCQYNGEYLAAIGDRVGQADTPYVKVKKSYFDWKEAKPVKRLDDTSEITSFYDDGYNRIKNFDPAGMDAEVEETGVYVPKIPLVPAEVALKIATTPTTPWELHQHTCDYKEGRDAAVKSMLTPVKCGRLWHHARRLTKKVASCHTHSHM